MGCWKRAWTSMSSLLWELHWVWTCPNEGLQSPIAHLTKQKQLSCTNWQMLFSKDSKKGPGFPESSVILPSMPSAWAKVPVEWRGRWRSWMENARHSAHTLPLSLSLSLFVQMDRNSSSHIHSYWSSLALHFLTRAAERLRPSWWSECILNFLNIKINMKCRLIDFRVGWEQSISNLES